MMSGADTVRAFAAALALTFFVGIGTAVSQTPNAPSPPVSSVNDELLLRELGRIEGRITIPDEKAALLEQPQGRAYRSFREGVLTWIGGVAVVGMLLALTAFYLTKGRIMLEPDEETGRKILRFNAFERFTHWMTAASFIILAVSGLNYIFGKRLLMPLIGPDAFATLSQWAKYAHNFLAWPFMLGVVLMIVIWVKDNVPDRYDAGWLKAGGGFFNDTHPDAARFNAGQKLIFWSVVLGGIALSISGILMLFPFALVDIKGMQIAQYVHAVVGVVLIAIMIAHIYIGSLGMEGAYDAMGSGEVDLTWAERHHRAWVAEQRDKPASAGQPGGPARAPAE